MKYMRIDGFTGPVTEVKQGGLFEVTSPELDFGNGAVLEASGRIASSRVTASVLTATFEQDDAMIDLLVRGNDGREIPTATLWYCVADEERPACPVELTMTAVTVSSVAIAGDASRRVDIGFSYETLTMRSDRIDERGTIVPGRSFGYDFVDNLAEGSAGTIPAPLEPPEPYAFSIAGHVVDAPATSFGNAFDNGAEPSTPRTGDAVHEPLEVTAPLSPALTALYEVVVTIEPTEIDVERRCPAECAAQGAGTGPAVVTRLAISDEEVTFAASYLQINWTFESETRGWDLALETPI